MVPPVGLEPTHLTVLDFESSASTNSTTGALQGLWVQYSNRAVAAQAKSGACSDLCVLNSLQ